MPSFWQEITKLHYTKDIYVFWRNGTMYIYDIYENQASTNNVTLFESYMFAVFIKASVFDYEATDEEVKTLHDELLAYYKEADKQGEEYYVNVWKYLDDIEDKFYMLTKRHINTIDNKREMVSYMSDTSEDECGMGYGSATYIARMLWNNIMGDKRMGIKPCESLQAKQLANEYLMTDDYDLNKFAKALKEIKVCEMTTPINFDQYLVQSSRISHKCYSLLGYLIENNIDCKKEILVGYIDWFGDYEEDERYIYCHINSNENKIYFQESRKSPTSAYLHDIAFPHLVGDPNRIQKDIGIKFTEQYIDDILKEIGNIDDAYTHCHMYGTEGKYTL